MGLDVITFLPGVWIFFCSFSLNYLSSEWYDRDAYSNMVL